MLSKRQVRRDYVTFLLEKKSNQKKTIQGCVVEMRCALVFVSVIVGATIARPRMTDVNPYKINKIGHITEENLQNDVSDIFIIY